MPKKFYAVKVGRKPGIYNTWDECKKQVAGYSGAVYKSFRGISEAKAFISQSSDEVYLEPSEIIAYVDGSYDDEKKLYSYGVVLIIGEKELHFSQKFDDSEPEMLEMRNVAGEISGAKKAMEYCISNGYRSINIYHDYDGIAKWCTGEWKANKVKTQEYRDYYNSIKERISINFIKVKGHSGDKYNELADKLAKEAINGIELGKEDTVQTTGNGGELISKAEVFIDKESVVNLINDCGNELWGNSFKFISFSDVGNSKRLEYAVLDKHFKIDFYFKVKGTVTIKQTSNLSKENSLLIKKIESKCFKNEHKNASCKFSNINDDVLDKLLSFINSQESINTISDERKVTTPPHRAIVLQSKFGDKITLRRFDNNNLQIQGNPAYVLSQIMYYMSIQDGITEEEINNSQKEIYNSNISIAESRNLLKERIPNAYDKIDSTIKKIISPAITLSNSSIEVEEYSCYVFPALKGLEAFLLQLLLAKSIFIDHAAKKGSGKFNSFGPVFEKDATTGLYVIRPSVQPKISDSTYEKCLADIYNFLVSNRHANFHANQILVLTNMIQNKEEADAILSEVFELIDDAALKLL